MQLQDYLNDVQELVHDSVNASWSQARMVARINEARLYTSMDMKCVRRMQTNIQLIQNQEVYPLQGVVAGLNLVSGGSNYGAGSTVPITISGGQSFQGGGVGPFGAIGQATAAAAAFGTLAGGVVTGATMSSWGYGYDSIPTVTVGGTGSGAVFTPVMIMNLLYPISLTYIFNGIRTTLRYLPFSLFQAYARILGVQFASTPGVWTWMSDQSQALGVNVAGGNIGAGGVILIQPPPNQNYIAELDACYMASPPLVNLTDVDYAIINPWQRAVQFAAASLLFLKDQDAGRSRSNYMAQQYMRMIPRIVTGVGGPRVPNIYNRNFQRMVAR